MASIFVKSKAENEGQNTYFQLNVNKIENTVGSLYPDNETLWMLAYMYSYGSSL